MKSRLKGVSTIQHMEIPEAILNSPSDLQRLVLTDCENFKKIPQSKMSAFLCELVFYNCPVEKQLEFYNLFPDKFKSLKMDRTLCGLPAFPFDKRSLYEWDEDSVAETVQDDPRDELDEVDTPDSW